jgi:hypothetical protein
LKDLRRFVQHFLPKRLVPIHTVRPDSYPRLFNKTGSSWKRVGES